MSEITKGTTNYTSTDSGGSTVYKKSSSNSNQILDGYKISELTRTNELHQDDLLVLSRSIDGGSSYSDSYHIKLSDTNIINSLESGALGIGELADVNIGSPAGADIIAFNGEAWTNYSWEYLMKDKFQIIEGIGPPVDTCDGEEWREITKIYACKTGSKFVFYFQTDA